jgi:hypothetical protein
LLYLSTRRVEEFLDVEQLDDLLREEPSSDSVRAVQRKEKDSMSTSKVVGVEKQSMLTWERKPQGYGR